MHSNALVGLGALLVSAALAGCGHGVNATQTSSNGTDKQSSMLRFSQCMRSHGVSDFPDPQTSSGGGASLQLSGGPGSDLSPDNPTFQHAQDACKSMLPNGGQMSADQRAKAQRQALAFSQCMRSHGVTDFPDPQFQSGPGGGIGIRIGRGDGKGGPGDLNPDDPIFQRAQQACQSQLGMTGPGGKASTNVSHGAGGAGTTGGGGFAMQIGG